VLANDDGVGIKIVDYYSYGGPEAGTLLLANNVFVYQVDQYR
jgi:hypothetical protein